MRTLLAAIVILLSAVAFQTSGSAQQPPLKPEFKDAPLTDVLLWAQQGIGCGFMYEAKDLLDPETQKVRRISASHIEPETKAQKTLLLLEILRKSGLVAFEVGGLPGPTYELVRGTDAATSAPVVTDISKLEGHYYAALTIRMHRASALEASERIKKVLTPGASHLEVIEDTHTLIVTDYTDRLSQAFEIAMALDLPTERADDAVISDFAPTNTVAARLATAVERLRAKGDEWKVTVNESANVVLISGRRDEVDTLVAYMKQIDAFPQKPEFEETTRSIKLFFVTAADAARTLREMFATQVAAGSIQIGAMESGRKLIFRGSAYDLERVKQNLKVIDVQPKGGAKNE
ncbi:MAG: secretin N-terminal domain-containing protein [Planctomycetota bacterium]|jgi:type II secretory pathway component GspD/PulD (secretin)